MIMMMMMIMIMIMIMIMMIMMIVPRAEAALTRLLARVPSLVALMRVACATAAVIDDSDTV